jgi:hypothetical protein
MISNKNLSRTATEVLHDLSTTTAGDRPDLETISGVLGIGRVGEDMQRITGLSAASLSRLTRGGGTDSRQWRHIATVAAVARQLVELLQGAGRASFDRAASRRWLHGGTVTIDGALMRPIDALEDQALTEALLNDLVAANRRG